MIDPAELDRFFKDSTKNRESILVTLWELSAIVTSGIHPGTADPQDIRSTCYAHAISKLDNFKPEKGSSAYSYFYSVMQRFAWRLVKDNKLGLLCPEHLNEDETGKEKLSKDVKDAVIPANKKKSKTEETDPVKVLDKVITKARKEFRDQDANGASYIESGLAWLQEYRFALTGSYLPMSLNSVHYSKNEVRSKG